MKVQKGHRVLACLRTPRSSMALFVRCEIEVQYPAGNKEASTEIYQGGEAARVVEKRVIEMKLELNLVH